MTYEKVDSVHSATMHERTEVNFSRVDLVTVEGVDLNVWTLIELRRGNKMVHLTFDILHRWCGRTFRFNMRGELIDGKVDIWEDPEGTIRHFLSDERSFVKAGDFLLSFRHVMKPAFDFAMTKEEMCGNMQLWDMLESSTDGEEGNA